MAKERRQKLTCLSAAPARPEEACSAGPPGRLCRPGFPGGVGKAPAAAGLPGTATRLPSLPRRLYVYRKITPKVRGRRKKTGPRLAVPARPGEHRCSTAGALREAPGSRGGASPSGGFPFVVVVLRQIPGGVVVPGGRPRGGGWQGVGKNSKISFEGFFFQGRGRRRRAGKRFLRRLYVYWKTTPKVRGAR